MKRLLSALLLPGLLAGCAERLADPVLDRPNVILIITDDQGYGDLGAHGNTMIRTPELDHLASESVRLTNFHVDPTCSPSRSALMTGRYSTRTGVWHTIMGRSLMAPDEVTLAEIFAENGYRTGMVGKWHLGDNYPLRPEDQGFQEVLRHGGGGVGQGPDYWGNDYFDDTYWRNGTPEAFTGYCTDVWFREARDFITRHESEPFFLYLSTNAPHGPYRVDSTYSRAYTDAGVPAPLDAFYGMITNIDENVGRLRAHLAAKGLEARTLLLFMTDNGSAMNAANIEPNASSWTGFNAGMRGNKGSEYEGGHRVPMFLYWPEGGLTGGRDVDVLAAHIDVLPTVVDLLGFSRPPQPELDGASLVPALIEPSGDRMERTLFVHSQRIEHPEKWRKSAVMTDRWRLVNGTELYDVIADPGQSRDVAALHDQVVDSLRSAYEVWWSRLVPVFNDVVRIGVGSNQENPVRLMSHDWHTENSPVPWHQQHVEQRMEANGYWALEVLETAAYRITLRLQPESSTQPLNVTEARLRIGDLDETRRVDPAATSVTFEIQLSEGPVQMQTWLTGADGRTFGAYFAEVERM